MHFISKSGCPLEQFRENRFTYQFRIRKNGTAFYIDNHVISKSGMRLWLCLPNRPNSDPPLVMFCG